MAVGSGPFEQCCHYWSWPSSEVPACSPMRIGRRNPVNVEHNNSMSAVAKIATARCQQPPSTQSSPADLKPYEKKADHGPWEKYREKDVEIVWDVCPPYLLPDNATVVQEATALTAAEQACRAEISSSEKSLQEQVSEYRRQHGIKEPAKSDVDYDALAKKAGAIESTLGTAACAAKVRRRYPGVYDDLDDATLMKKVLAKYRSIANPTPVIHPALNQSLRASVRLQEPRCARC